MDFDIRPLTADDLRSFVTMIETAAGRHVSDTALAHARESHEPARMLAAFEGDRIVAGTGSDVLELTVPSTVTVPAARIILSGVLPTHRGRGLMSALIRRLLRDLRTRGEPLAILTTVVPEIVGRFDLRPATVAMAIEIEPTAAMRSSVPEPSGSLRLLGREEMPAMLPELFDRHRREQPGQVSRRDYFWRMWFLDRELYRIGSSERFAVAFHDSTGTAQGYLTYRIEYGPLRNQPVRALVVEDLVAITDEARRALWRYCLHFDQASVVTATNVPIDECVIWLLADRRRLRVTRLRDFLFVRLIDVATALAARRYEVSGTVVLDVTDPILPENGGRYLLEGGPDGARCVATTRTPCLALTVAELAAVYLGGVSFTTLARAGLVTEHVRGALGRADVMFASRPAPWTVTDW